MAKQTEKTTERAKGGKRLRVKKQPLKDLETRKTVKGGLTPIQIPHRPNVPDVLNVPIVRKRLR